MSETEKDVARRAALRAYKSEWQRRKRAARQAAGVCTVCGKRRDEGTGDTYKGICLACTEDVRRREILRRESERATTGKAPTRGWRRKVSLRVCRHCKGRNLVASGPPWARAGKPGEQRQRFLCLTCEKWSYGAILPTPPDNLCPYCKGRCVRAGVLPSGSQQYLCVVCGRRNTNLFPGRRKDTSGPFRRVVTFYFGPLGGKALTDYCNRKHLAASRALRELLQAASVPIVPVMATATRDWPLGARRQVSHVRLRNTEPSAEPLREAPRRLPDIRRAVNRARMQAPGGRRHRPVAVA